MLKEERFEHVLTVLKENQKVTYESLAEQLNVSEDTVRRDIEMLHRSGLLTKVRGGAILRSINPLSFQDRKEFLSDGKSIIAIKAQQLIKNGQTLFMDGGTTLCAVASNFPLDSEFRVVTNNQALIPILTRFPNIEIIVLGGSYNRNTETNTGIQTCKEAEKYVADVYLMGVCAIDRKFGVTAADRDEGEVKQAMLKSSIEKVMLSNGEKIGTTDHFKVCSIADINVLITDLPSNDLQLDPFRSFGIRLI